MKKNLPLLSRSKWSNQVGDFFSNYLDFSENLYFKLLCHKERNPELLHFFFQARKQLLFTFQHQKLFCFPFLLIFDNIFCACPPIILHVQTNILQMSIQYYFTILQDLGTWSTSINPRFFSWLRCCVTFQSSETEML